MSVLERVREQASQFDDVQDQDVLVRHDRTAIRGALKNALVEHLGLTQVATLVTSGGAEVAREELSVACFAVLNSGSFEEVPSSERESLVREVIDEIVGLGPLQPLLEDSSITEIMVNGSKQLFFEREGCIEPAQRVFDSQEQIMLVLERILAPLGRRLDDASPIVNARLKDGTRVNAVISPIAIDGPVVSIRKFSGRIRSLDALVSMESLPAWYAQMLRWAVRLRADIAVAGGTGSGKTTLLNALSAEIPANERIITIEDSAELQFDEGLHVVRLEARDASIEGTGQVSIRDLVTNALRMRPDRIVVGECRGPETIDMLQAMNTGHDGSLTTLHAGSETEAISRLVLMARLGLDLPSDLIEEQVATALDLIVMSRRMSDGSRVVSSVSEVERTSDGHVELKEVISFDIASRSWHLVCVPHFLRQAVLEHELSAEEVSAWESSCLPVAA